MSNGSAKHFRMTARVLRDSDLESVRAVTEPELNSQRSASFRRNVGRKFANCRTFVNKN
jgi:hypothetical protein